MKHPTPDEIKTYWTESKLAGDPEEFYDHFKSNGWMVGKAPMKDWQAAARNWSRNEIKWGKSAPVIQGQPTSASVSDRQAEVDAELAEERKLWQERNR